MRKTCFLKVISVSAAGEEGELLTSVTLPASSSLHSKNVIWDPGSSVKDPFCNCIYCVRVLQFCALGRMHKADDFTLISGPGFIYRNKERCKRPSGPSLDSRL